MEASPGNLKSELVHCPRFSQICLLSATSCVIINASLWFPDMFIATMYSYGDDNSSVGVDGILGCMAIFVIYGNTLFAIHIPDTPAHFNAGRAAFVNHVTSRINHFQPWGPGYNGQNAKIIAVVNGNNRAGGHEELLNYAGDLNISDYQYIRLRDNLGPAGAGRVSAAVICEFVGGGNPVL